MHLSPEHRGGPLREMQARIMGLLEHKGMSGQCYQQYIIRTALHVQALDHYAIFQCNFISATALNFFLDAHLVPDEVTPFRRQYYLLRDA